MSPNLSIKNSSSAKKVYSEAAEMTHRLVKKFNDAKVEAAFKHDANQEFYERLAADVFVMQDKVPCAKSFTQRITALIDKLPPQSKMPIRQINGIMTSIENKGEKIILNLSEGEAPWTATFWGVFDRNKTLREGIYMDHDCKAMFARKPNGVKSLKYSFGKEERSYKGLKDSNWMLLTRDGAGFIMPTKSFLHETSPDMRDFLVSVFL